MFPNSSVMPKTEPSGKNCQKYHQNGKSLTSYYYSELPNLINRDIHCDLTTSCKKNCC